MFELRECTRDNFCFECDNENCAHHGDIGADCPKYRCDQQDDCEHCEWIRGLIKEIKEDMRDDKNE